MKIYIDNEFKCRVHNDGTMREFDVPFFDDACVEFIEGYRYVPDGETWTDTDGTVFRGEFTAPWKSYEALITAQQAADRIQEQADEQIMELLDVIEELIIGG